MQLSVFDLFKIGIGPSSSHTVGPMWATVRFVRSLAETGRLSAVQQVRVDLFGSLALTGRGHATDKAVLLGLSGEQPDRVDPHSVEPLLQHIRSRSELHLNGTHRIAFCEATDLVFHMDQFLPAHPNGMRCTAYDANQNPIVTETYYSVGGGFVVREGEADSATVDSTGAPTHGASAPASSSATATKARPGNSSAAPSMPFEFRSAAELLAIGQREHLSIAEIVRANERALRSDAEIDAGLDRLWSVMENCIERGCRAEGVLPGGLNVRRRAGRIYRELQARPVSNDPLTLLDWVSLFALAVNEENAAGGQVVTAPTNGAAGVIPAVLAYYRRFMPGANAEGVRTFLLTAAAIGMLYKRNASLSAAEMGCQGEVGVACSMAAAGLAAVMGGSNAQIENAAEIGMEHNLGLTCDPVGGLVQVPCIERNTMGATKAINAARLAVLYGDGSHRVPLDRVIETMRQTGLDMQAKYKETSRGGLAVNMVDC